MSCVENMRAFVSQRLNSAVEEILAAFEKAIQKYEEEAALSQEVIARQHALLCALHKPLMESPSADVFTQQLLLSKEVSSQKDQNPQQDIVPQSLFKEEQQEEQLQDLDENEIIEFTYNSSRAVKSCEDLQPLVEPRPVDPDRNVPLVLSSETEDSEDYSKDPADLTPTTDKSQVLCRPKGFSCSVCNRTFKACSFLLRHLKAHVLEAKQVCSLCSEQFETADDLRHHLLTHRRKKKLQTQARTQNREKRLQERIKLNRAAKVQETQKPDKCNDCGKTLLRLRHSCRSQRKNQDPKNPEKTKKRKRRKT
ncbi:zinc finger protein 836-like [Melanotaenia boesemani]|uniref:zinc finger protein 836-like n=1 Tax=Melanotaenia boesemani TaxID=1250792 RepID=UPI001C05D619|nr:zinc finger protein 836-like [Melanotaenia boesemani]